MRLYVANCTKQNQVICYRLTTKRDGLLRFEPAKQQEIRPGHQAPIGPDFDDIDAVQKVVDQLARYGMISVKDIANYRGRHTVPLVFNVEKSVPADAIRKMMNINTALLIDMGQLRRRRAAVGINETVSQIVEKQFAEIGLNQAPTENIDLSVEQLEQTPNGEKTIAEGFRVRAGAPGAPPPRQRRNRNRTAETKAA